MFSYWTLKNYIVIDSLRHFCSYFFTICYFKVSDFYYSLRCHRYFIRWFTIYSPVIPCFCNFYSFRSCFSCWSISQCNRIDILWVVAIWTFWWCNFHATIFISHYARCCRCYRKNYLTFNFSWGKCCSSCTIRICIRIGTSWEFCYCISCIFT